MNRKLFGAALVCLALAVGVFFGSGFNSNGLFSYTSDNAICFQPPLVKTTSIFFPLDGNDSNHLEVRKLVKE